MNIDKTVHENAYVTCKKHVKTGMIKALSIVIGFQLFFYFAADGFKEPIWVVFSFIILFPIIFLSLGVSYNNKVFLNQNYISFQALHNPKEPKIYKWENINMCVIGDVQVKHSRVPYNIFGIQIFYLEEIGSKTYADFNTYPLKHLIEYEKLIEDIKNICNKYNIKYLDQREGIGRSNGIHRR